MINLLCVDHVTKILGGGEINLLQLLERIDRERFDPLAACGADGTLDRELELRGLPRTHFHLGTVISEFRLVNRRFNISRALRSVNALRQAVNQIARIAEQAKTHLLLSVTNKDHFAAGMAARRIGRPSVWWVNDIISHDFFSPMTVRIFMLMARRYADQLVAVSGQGRDALIDLGIDGEKITVIHNGIDPDLYRRVDGNPLRASLGVPEEAPLVTTLGRVTPWKGHQLFVDMAKIIAQERPDAHFWIAGGVFNEDQGFANNLQREADAALGNRLHFLGFRKDVKEIFSASDVVVHCSLKPEPFGRVLIEAMACEVPVVAACGGGVKEIIESGDNGFLVTTGDAHEYAKKIIPLLGNREQARNIGLRGRSTVLNRFSIDRMVRQFEDLFCDIIAK
jgi:glycosyltransferase involved in cell wall biosynthesis